MRKKIPNSLYRSIKQQNQIPNLCCRKRKRNKKKGQRDRVRGMERVNWAIAVCYLCSGVCPVLHAQFGPLMCVCQGSEGHPEWEHCSLFLSTLLSPFLCVCVCVCDTFRSCAMVVTVCIHLHLQKKQKQTVFWGFF